MLFLLYYLLGCKVTIGKPISCVPTFIFVYIKLINPNNLWFEVHYYSHYFTSEAMICNADDFAQLTFCSFIAKYLCFSKLNSYQKNETVTELCLYTLCVRGIEL